jgi:hypothetical protein
MKPTRRFQDKTKWQPFTNLMQLAEIARAGFA